MVIYIDKDIKNLKEFLKTGTVIDIGDLNQYSIDELLALNHLVVVASSAQVAPLVSELVNSRPNEKKPMTLVQTHPNLTLLVDKEGAKNIL